MPEMQATLSGVVPLGGMAKTIEDMDFLASAAAKPILEAVQKPNDIHLTIVIETSRV